VRGILQRRLSELTGQTHQSATPGERTPQELDRLAHDVRAKAKEKQRVEAKSKRIAALQDLSTRKKETWESITSLIEEKKANPYAQAVALLAQLRDLAKYEDEFEEFQKQIKTIAGRYASRRALMERLRSAGLLD
jgi:vacuolar-type H+-ATPase subunit I/STV1